MSSPRRPERKNKDLRIRAAAGMKVFATELRGKTVMTEDGQILGILADFLVETKTGRIPSLLVTPAETVETRLFKTDPGGRLTLEFGATKAVRDLMRRIPGLHSSEALDPTDMAWEPPAFSSIFITHVHYDHIQQLRFVDPNIPVHLGEGARTILESLDTTARAPFLKLGNHAYQTFRSGQTKTVDGLEVEPIHVDHSAPAAYGYLVHTSEGTIAYTGDLRHHGP